MIIVPATPEGEVLTNDSITYIMSSIEAMVATLRLSGIHDDVDGGRRNLWRHPGRPDWQA